MAPPHGVAVVQAASQLAEELDARSHVRASCSAAASCPLLVKGCHAQMTALKACAVISYAACLTLWCMS